MPPPEPTPNPAARGGALSSLLPYRTSGPRRLGARGSLLHRRPQTVLHFWAARSRGPNRSIWAVRSCTGIWQTRHSALNATPIHLSRTCTSRPTPVPAATIGLDKAGVITNPKNGKIPTLHEQTNVPHIYAIGDVIDGEALQPPSALTELTPVAIQAGKHLANRLYAGKSTTMNYQNVPTTVYTPLEYGCVGYTEEEAEAKFGKKSIEVYHTYFTPLELTLPHRGENSCYAKLICNKDDDERVVGLHICGPQAGEMTQGFAVAIKCGATKDDFDDTVGIHPTNAEQFTTIHVTKSSGESAETTGC